MGHLNQFIAAISATIGAFGLGTVLSWSSPAIQSLKEDYSSKVGLISEEQESWIGSIVTLGCLASGPVSGISIQKIGRKKSMLFMSAPFVLGWLLIAYAQNLAMLLVGRILTGFCGGSFSVSAPLYISEIAETDVRGMLGTGFQLMLTIGILFGYVVGAFVDWQWLSLICAIVPLVFLVAMIFVPESPRYWLEKNRRDDASKALKWFRGADSEGEVEMELEEMEKAVLFERQEKTSLAELKERYNLVPFSFMVALMLFQQLSGINAVIFYAKDIFTDAGADLDADLSSIIIGIVQVFATLGGSLLVDRLGRRLLLLISSSVMTVSLVALGIFFQLKDDGKSDSIGWLPLISLMAFIVAFSIGYGPLPWMMLGELLPPKFKSAAGSFCAAFNWFCSFIVTKFFGQIQDALTIQWCYWIFAIVCVTGTAFVMLLVPETKGKAIDEIQAYFGAPQRQDEKSKQEEL